MSAPAWIRATLARLDTGDQVPGYRTIHAKPEARKELRGLLLMTERDKIFPITQRTLIRHDGSILLNWGLKGRSATLTLTGRRPLDIKGWRDGNKVLDLHLQTHIDAVRIVLPWVEAQVGWEDEYGGMTNEEIVNRAWPRFFGPNT
jgi:hypothetical protein